MNAKVIDVSTPSTSLLSSAVNRSRLIVLRTQTLLSSGAHISRYLVQCAMHHYYRTAQVPFIKTPWVRSMHLAVFTYFQIMGVGMFGNIPLGKGDDDGSTVEAVIKESRFPAEQRTVKLETLREILEEYKVRKQSREVCAPLGQLTSVPVHALL
jgi:hypothetical protein